MDSELTKSEKKIARKIIDNGIDRDLAKCNQDIKNILDKWATGNLSNREAYGSIYSTVRKNDKYIADMYDNLTGSHYRMTIVAMLINHVIIAEDISEFSQERQEELLETAKMLMK